MSLRVELHDATVDDPQGTLCARFVVDYEYQLEQWLIDLVKDSPEIVLVKVDDGRVWRRQGDEFVLSPIVAP
jgi:hypothetical protein